MKFHRLTFLAPMAMLASIALSPAQAHAQQDRSKSSTGPAAQTRAEVLADLQVWRASGLATFEVDPSFPLVGSPSHQAARARYEQMRTCVGAGYSNTYRRGAAAAARCYRPAGEVDTDG